MRVLKTIKLIFVIMLAVLALGYCGQMDSEYEAVREQIVTKGSFKNE